MGKCGPEKTPYLNTFHAVPVSRTRRNKVSCNQIAVNQADRKEVGRHFFQVKKEGKEKDLPDMLQQMYNHEFTKHEHLVNKDVADMS